MTIHVKHHPVLIALARADFQTQRNLLRSLSPPIIRILAQIASNIVNGDIKLNKKQLKKVSKYKNTLRVLRDNPKSRRQTLLKQKGGFLPFLIPLVASAVGGLLGKTLQ